MVPYALAKSKFIKDKGPNLSEFNFENFMSNSEKISMKNLAQYIKLLKLLGLN